MGRIATLTQFVPASAQRCLPFFKTLYNGENFNWDSECEKDFQELKVILALPPVADEAVSAALVIKESRIQSLVYFMYKTLHGSELNYQTFEKVAYTLLLASRCLRPYFQCHPITVNTNQPIRQVLH
jgi:hypothetical protein